MATGRPVIVPVDFPPPPDVGTPEAASAISLERLLHWDHAPENPARLQAAGVAIALTSHGLDSPRAFLAAVRKAVRRGLAADDALRALTVSPARLLEIDRLVGTLEPGKLAHFCITDGELFETKTKLLETWVDGTRFVIESPSPVDLRGTWQLAVQGREQTPELVLSGKPERLKAVWRQPHPEDTPLEEDPKDEPLKKFELRESQLTGQFDAKSWQLDPGVVLLSATLVPEGDDAQRMIGRVTLPDGSQQEFIGRRTSTRPSSSDEDPEAAIEGPASSPTTAHPRNRERSHPAESSARDGDCREMPPLAEDVAPEAVAIDSTQRSGGIHSGDRHRAGRRRFTRACRSCGEFRGELPPRRVWRRRRAVANRMDRVPPGDRLDV